jgi:peptide methionine sulfoxide reductase MsrB
MKTTVFASGQKFHSSQLQSHAADILVGCYLCKSHTGHVLQYQTQSVRRDEKCLDFQGLKLVRSGNDITNHGTTATLNLVCEP